MSLPPAGASAIVLASRSPRRIELIERLGLPFTVQPSAFNERGLSFTDPIIFAREAASGKASEVARQGAQGLIVGMDTVVHLERQLLGKPSDEADARRMLRTLSGRWHKVTTGVALIDQGRGASWLGDETSQVEFEALSVEQIDAYVATGEPLDKAGAYGIQGRAAEFVVQLQGDYFNVVGFPVSAFLEGLSRFLDVSQLVIPAPPARFKDAFRP